MSRRPPSERTPQGLRDPGSIALVSCYELGHPPHGLAVPLAFFERAGFAPLAIDIAVESLTAERTDALLSARLIAISVPMHTALRLGARLTQQLRAFGVTAHICCYGHYAPLNADYLRSVGVDSVFGGECEPQLVALAEALACGGDAAGLAPIAHARLDFPPPSRRRLPVLERYTKLERAGVEYVAGYTETTRGCKHRCRHCPIPAVYDGRFFAVDADTVLADVGAQVDAGARHITFGDADFFNGPRHGLAIARALHRRWPHVTFDATIKISHLLAHADHLRALADSGCAFVVSAVESLSDEVLARLDKGHTRADVIRALALCRDAGLIVRPTFVPFTPWTTMDDVLDLVDTLVELDLLECVDPVQLSVRLLVPPGSLLLAAADTRDAFGALDAEALSHRWQSADPRVDELQRAIAATVERTANRDDAFAEIRALVHAAAGRPPPVPVDAGTQPTRKAPRMTEPWFC